MEKTININELLDGCKLALGAKSDYQMAQMLEMNKGRISEFRSGKRVPDTYACTRMAQALKRDPLEIIAMVEANSAKNETQREFWRSFKFFGTHNGLGLLLFGTLAFSGAGLPGGNANAGVIASSHNVYYVK